MMCAKRTSNTNLFALSKLDLNTAAIRLQCAWLLQERMIETTNYDALGCYKNALLKQLIRIASHERQSFPQLFMYVKRPLPWSCNSMYK